MQGAEDEDEAAYVEKDPTGRYVRVCSVLFSLTRVELGWFVAWIVVFVQLWVWVFAFFIDGYLLILVHMWKVLANGSIA